MTKTCYFCKNYDDCEVYSDSEACDVNFQPNADWLEYEALKKENEELKKQVEDLRVGLQVSGAIINELEIPKKKVKE